MYHWSCEWKMLFNVDKCKCLHIGYNNNQYDYFIGDELVQNIKEEKDLGVIIDHSLSCSTQCAQAAKTANRKLGQIKRTFTYKSKGMVKKLYKALVRPHLEYCIQAWRPWLQKDVNLLENVQRRMTRLIPGWAETYTYEERLRLLNLTSLETRRLRGDLIEVFKIFRGLEDIKLEDFFTLQTGVTRGHCYKIKKFQTRLDIRKYTFSQRIVNEWNNLPPAVVNSNSLNTFKDNIDKHLKHRMEAYTSQRVAGSLPRQFTP